jgi:hypothetical protein
MHTNKTERLTVEHTEKKKILGRTYQTDLPLQTEWRAGKKIGRQAGRQGKRRFAGKGQIKEINSN